MKVPAIHLSLQNLAADKHICHAENRCNQKYRQHDTENGHPALFPVNFCGYGNKVKITLHLFSLPNP